MSSRIKPGSALLVLLLAFASVTQLTAQSTPASAVKQGGSPNIHTLAHLGLGDFMTIGGIEIEQEPARPFVYMNRWREQNGFDVISIADPANPKIIYSWRFGNPEKHSAWALGESGKYFKTHGRYYYVRAIEFSPGTLDADIGAIVFDVTGLPDPTKVKEVVRIRGPEIVEGFTNVYPYKHSDGRSLLFAPVHDSPPGTRGHTNIYDLDKMLAGAPNFGLIGSVPIPEVPLKEVTRGYHDVYVAYDVAKGQDRYYGAGTGGFHIFDVTHPENAQYIGSISGISGVQNGHTIIATPDARYAVTQMEYQFSPIMFFDIKPLLDGSTKNISKQIAAWTPDWRDLPHNHEVRWPYVFDAAYEDGLQILDMRDATNPKQVGWFYTCGCEHNTGFVVRPMQLHGPSVFSGAMEVDIRNSDGLIVLSDLNTGFWAFRMDGFKGWNGNDYDMPNISSVQDWDNGPVKQAATRRSAT
jgi:hypothetical protein